MSEKMLNGDAVYASHEEVLKNWFESANKVEFFVKTTISLVFQRNID